MSDYTTTPNYGLYKPTPDADNDAWGGHLNANFDRVDNLIFSLNPATGTAVPAINPITGTYGMNAFHGDIYESADAYALTGSMTVRGMPYGYYDTGTLLSLVATTGPLSSSRAGIAGGFENGVSAIAGYGSFDTVNIYSGIRSEAPPLVLHSVTYDATHVFPHPNLTPTQVSKLRHSMYVLTNSIDNTISTTPPGPNMRPPENHYAGLVTGWATDGSSITVSGWTVPGSGHTAAGQVPPVGTLDAGAPNATAYFGSATNMFGGNFMAQHNPASAPDSRTYGYQGIEFDFQNFGTVNYEMRVAGLSLNYSSYGGPLVYPTADSYGITASGFPTGIILRYNAVGISIDPNNTTTAVITGALNILNEKSPVPWAGSPVTNLTWEANNYIDANVLRLQCWTSRDVATAGWPGASLHLGMRVDGTPLTMAGGSPMAQLVWNPQGFAGGLQIQNQAGVAGFSIASTGAISLRGTTTNDNAVAGQVGESITSTVVVGSAVPLTTGAVAAVTSISLTAGDWNVYGSVGFQPTGTTTISSVIGAVNSSAALPGPAGSGYAAHAATMTTGAQQVLAGMQARYSLASTTTIYLLAQAAFGASTMGAFGTITARRHR